VPPAPASTAELAILVLQRNATEFLEHAPGARVGADPYHVHQMRVATRRLRAALRLFADILPPEAASLNADLKWFANQLGPVRDLDVQIQRMHSTVAELGVEATSVSAYADWLDHRRERARTTLAEAFESRRFGALVQRLQRLDAWAPEAIKAPNNAPVYQDAPGRLSRAFTQLRKRADVVDARSAAADLHAVRIRAKRLRYTAEFFEPLYGKPGKRLVSRVVSLQDLLGSLQDGVVSREHIHAAVDADPNGWPAQTSLALGQMIQHEAQRDTHIRHAFPDVYRAVRNKSWKRLRKAFRRAAKLRST
jgi:triphosphatase